MSVARVTRYFLAGRNTIVSRISGSIQEQSFFLLVRLMSAAFVHGELRRPSEEKSTSNGE